MAKILYCKQCKAYTLSTTCPKCKNSTVNPEPAKFSIKDKYGKYRRIAKKGEQN